MEEEEGGAVSVKDEISSITKQFDSLNRKAYEDAAPVIRPKQPVSPTPAAAATVVTAAAVDENKNSSPSNLSDQKIKQVDILPGRDHSHRFKSTYNGPMGSYSHSAPRPHSPPAANTSEATETVASPEAESPPPSPPRERTPPPVPPRPDKTLEAAVAAADVSGPQEPEAAPERSPDLSPVKAVTPAKYPRTKSQEFRDYQHEFMLSSIIDFGPLQPVNNGDNPSSLVTSTPIAKPPPPEARKHSASQSPLASKRKTPSPEKNDLVVPAVSSCQKLDFDDHRPAANGGNHDMDNSKKVEIKPSDSFLLDLNKNSNSEQEKTSSDSTPVIDSKKQPPMDPKMEKILADRTNSLLRKNPTKTSDDLLEWAKITLSGYSNVKVTNFTTSWRNGIAFCGLIHHFYPDLIAYDTLTQHDIKQNCKLAFEAGEKLGIPRVIEPENMVIKRIPDKLAVITYLHQLRSALGQEETNILYEKSKDEQLVPATGVRKSFSDGHISLFSRTNSTVDKERSDLETIEENSAGVEIKPEKITEYAKRAKTLIEQARSESKDSDPEDEIPDTEPTTPSSRGNSSSPPKVLMRQKSNTPKSKKDNRLSYFDNEMQMLDAEQQEIDIQASILDRRLRETSEDDQVLYDALLQQWFTLVNKKNALLRRQMQLNILKKEDNLENKLAMLQEELRGLSEMEECRKTEDARKREDLLLQELVLVVNKRNELVMQRDEEEKMLHDDEQLDEEITLPENNHLRINRRDECKMQ